MTRNLVASYAALVAEVVLALALTAYAVYRLGGELFGVWLVIFGITGYLALLDLGFSAAMLRHAAIEAGGQATISSRSLLRRSARYLGPLALLVLAIGAGAGWAIPRVVPTQADPGTLFAVSMLAAVRSLFVVMLGVLGGTLRGFKQGHKVDLASTVASIATLAGGLGMLWAGSGLLSLVVPALVAGAGQVLFLAWQLGRTMPAGPLELPPGGVPRNLVVFSGLVLANMLAGRLVFQTDALVVGAMIGAGAAASYALTFRAAELGMLVSFRISDTSYPFLTSTSAGRDKALVLASLRVTAAVAGLGAAMLVLLNQRFVGLWVGDDQFAGQALGWIFAYLVLHHAVLHAGSVALHANGRIKGLVVVSILEAGLNIALSIALAVPLGMLGVAIGTVLAGWATSAWYIPLTVARLLDIPLPSQVRAIARPLLAALLATTPFLWLRPEPGGWLELILLGAALAASHAAAFWFLGSSRDDRATWTQVRHAGAR